MTPHIDARNYLQMFDNAIVVGQNYTLVLRKKKVVLDRQNNENHKKHKTEFACFLMKIFKNLFSPLVVSCFCTQPYATRYNKKTPHTKRTQPLYGDDLSAKVELPAIVSFRNIGNNNRL